jgi:hypothetical protein
VDQVIDPADPDALDAVPVDEPGPGRTVAIVAAWVAVVAVIGVALWIFFTNVVDTTSSSGASVVASYTKGETGKKYSSVRDGFRVTLPTTPRRREFDDAAGPTVVVDSRPGSGYLFSVTRSAQNEDTLANFTAALNTAAGSIVSDSGGEIVSQTDPVQYGTVVLKDVVFRKGAQWYRTRLVLSADRLYAVQAQTKSKDPAPFDHLWKTFQILQPR